MLSGLAAWSGHRSLAALIERFFLIVLPSGPLLPALCAGLRWQYAISAAQGGLNSVMAATR